MINFVVSFILHVHFGCPREALSMQLLLFFLIITNPCPALGHGLGPEHGPSSSLGPNLVLVLRPGHGFVMFPARSWSRSWSCHIFGPGLGPGPGKNFWFRPK